MRFFRATLLLLVLLALPATASAAPPRDFFGTMIDGPFTRPEIPFDRSAEARVMRRAGIGTVRVVLNWSAIEPQPGQFDWRASDGYVRLLARQRIRILPVLYLAPAWARTGDAGDEGSPPRADAFAAFARAAVRRYGTRGSFWRSNRRLPKVPARQWQSWNEPMLERYWNVQPWPASYTALLKSAYPAIKRADRRAKVVSAGMTGDLDTLTQALYDAGAKGSFDAIGMHPYRPRVADVFRALAEAREVIRRNGDRAGIAATEVSFTSGAGFSTENIGIERTERGQRAALVDVMRGLVARRKRLGLTTVIWYSWLSYPPGDKYTWEYAGLRRLTNSGPVSKPALSGFRSVAR